MRQTVSAPRGMYTEDIRATISHPIYPEKGWSNVNYAEQLARDGAEPTFYNLWSDEDHVLSNVPLIKNQKAE